MIVVGDVSGIQRYVFDVADEGGGQARRPRARSFWVQVVAEAAAIRVVRTMNWNLDASLVFSAAGRFTLRGLAHDAADQKLRDEERQINQWLLDQTNGE